MARITCPCGHRINLDDRSLNFFIIPKIWFDEFINTIDKLRHLVRDDDEFRGSVGEGLSGSYDPKRPKIVECPACRRLLVYCGNRMVSYAPDNPKEGRVRPLLELFPPAEESMPQITKLAVRYRLSQFNLRRELSLAEVRVTVGKESLTAEFPPKKYYEYRLEDGRYLALHFLPPNEDQLVSAEFIDATTGQHIPAWPLSV